MEDPDEFTYEREVKGRGWHDTQLWWRGRFLESTPGEGGKVS